MATNVPAPSLTDTGFAAPADADILQGLFADLQTAFGGNLNPSLSTPQGQLVMALTAILGNANSAFLAMANGIDPVYASGRFQDAIGRLYFLTRNPAVSTLVAATIVGSPGTLVPAGSLAQAADGTIYQSTGDATIGLGGTASDTFAAIVPGPTSCPAGALNRIYRSVNGWDAITNAADGIIGTNVESRNDFEARRANSVALNAIGVLPSVKASVLNVSGVIDAYVTENATGSSMTVGSVMIAPRSIYVAAQGGADLDVATAIWRKKPPGCAYNGNTTVTVQDQSSGYAPPFPSYQVTFQRPASLPIYFAVTIANSASVPSDVVTRVRNAIIASFNGQDGGTGVHIGATIYSSRYVANVAALGDWAQIAALHVGTTAGPTTDMVSVGINQFPSIAAANISVVLA